MIRLLGQGHAPLRHSRRRRISNQLAAFAAIMLFASTQVPAPDTAEVETGPAALAMSAPAGQVDVEADALAMPTVSGKQDKSRGLNLSLFLLRR